MNEPLKQDQRVIADTSIDGVYQDGTAYVIPIVIGEEGKDFWRYPLSDATLELLAQTAHDAFFEEGWESAAQIEHELWRNVITAVFARLMDGEG